MRLSLLTLICLCMSACGTESQPATEERTNSDPAAVRAELNQFIEDWHHAAANSDFGYFDLMSPQGVYIGTDKTELWHREEFREWSREYFEADRGWDFNAKERHIYLSENGDLAWFDELLDTHMGVCRGSGVLSRADSSWQIEHYHLSVTVPNDTLAGFVEMVRAFEASRTDSTRLP